MSFQPLRSHLTGTQTLPSLTSANLQFEGDGSCAYAVRAEIVTGPGAGNTLEGTLQFTVDPDGSMRNGALAIRSGEQLPVVGHVAGSAIRFLLTLLDGQLVAFHGVAAQPLDVCSGEIHGQFGGPELENVGVWSASAGG